MVVLSPVLRDISHMCGNLFDFILINRLIEGKKMLPFEWHGVFFYQFPCMIFQCILYNDHIFSYLYDSKENRVKKINVYLSVHKHIISQCCSEYIDVTDFMRHLQTHGHNASFSKLKAGRQRPTTKILKWVLNKNKLFIKRLLCIAHIDIIYILSSFSWKYIYCK